MRSTKIMIVISTAASWFGIGLGLGQLPKPIPLYVGRVYAGLACILAGWYGAKLLFSKESKI